VATVIEIMVAMPFFVIVLYKQTTNGQVGIPLLVHRVATSEVLGDKSTTMRAGCIPHYHRQI
jgi:hypothetical protein